MTLTRFHTLPDGRRMAYRYTPGFGPALVFLPGYMSDMAGGKATAVFDWAVGQARECLLLDYPGCGASEGHFRDGTLSDWRGDVVCLLSALCVHPVALVGSSLGGWLMLLVALEIPLKINSLVGIAAAPDFTEWGFDDEQKTKLASGEILREDSAYGPEPTPTYPAFWADGQANRLLGREIAIDCPVRLIHGQGDPDVPWEVSLRLAEKLRSADVQVQLVKDGDHRLSRDQDIALLINTLAALPGVP
ncbi:MAG: alpha/beta hydrolase [Sphingomonadales bacterium]|nr:alpha/beta hydrolase [Sphingomonadaceae bacterium]MBS3929993.1 alpha/beta hydrolase [Sphingomonadales bacterium]